MWFMWLCNHKWVSMVAVDGLAPVRYQGICNNMMTKDGLFMSEMPQRNAYFLTEVVPSIKCFIVCSIIKSFIYKIYM